MTDAVVGYPISCDGDMLTFFLRHSANFSFCPKFYFPLILLKRDFEDFCRELSYYPGTLSNDVYLDVLVRHRSFIQCVELEWPVGGNETLKTAFVIGLARI